MRLAMLRSAPAAVCGEDAIPSASAARVYGLAHDLHVRPLLLQQPDGAANLWIVSVVNHHKRVDCKVDGADAA